MKPVVRSRAARALALLALVAVLPIAARGQSAVDPPGRPTLTATQARTALDVLQNPRKREQVISVLRTIAGAAPAAAPVPTGKPASPAVLTPNSLGAQLIITLSAWCRGLAGEASAALQTVNGLPELWRWAAQLEADPERLMSLTRAAGALALVFGAALLLEFWTARTIERPRKGLMRRLPRGDGERMRHLRLLPFAMVGLFLDLAPVAVFAVSGNLAIAAVPGINERVRLAAAAVINAYAAFRVSTCVVRALLSADDHRLRLWHLGDAAATFTLLWARRLIGVAIFGNLFLELASLFGLDQRAQDGFARMIVLVLALMMIAIVIRSRRGVASYIRRRGASRWWNWLAEAWPYLAVIAVATFCIGLSTSERSALSSLYFPSVTIAAIIGSRLLTIIVLGAVDRIVRLDPEAPDDLPGLARRMAYYRRPLEIVATAVIAALCIVVVLQLWGAPAFAWLAGGIGSHLLSALITIGVAVVAAIVAWEMAQALLERHLLRLTGTGQHRSARLLTLLPLLRTALLATISTVVGLTALSEIGVNIAPLLAGAGIAGIALGFGAQRLVQDVITGIFVVFEDAIQIGDGVVIAGLSGVVEQLSVRTLRLRAGDGALHIIPFSAVTSITNSNRGFGNAAVSVTVGYHEDTDRVTDVLRDIAAALRGEEEFSPMIVGDFQLFGVDQVKPWGATITGQIPCTDGGRWAVQREFNRRLKRRFTELNIALSGPPFASQ
jgi:moderate conductance mechanosensitive channel